LSNLLFDIPVPYAAVKLKPLVKWTGGKYEEFEKFRNYIPAFKNYYEPFFGGGGVFFALQPAGKSYLNDKSNDLARFYSLLASSAFKKELFLYADAFEQAGLFSHAIIKLLAQKFTRFVHDKTGYAEMKEAVHQAVDAIEKEKYHPLFSPALVLDTIAFTAKIKASLADKFKRIKDICAKRDMMFTPAELEEHIETGVKSGLYLFLRSILNKASLGTLQLTEEKATANWYFVREFCYASMFRINQKKEFNIPYGGIAYNSKNFRLKAEKIFAPAVQKLFSKATFYNLDFEAFLKKAAPATDDFVFLDPPYDSEFSEYDQNAFTKNDQVRLRDTLVNLQARWMLVIKETPFIRELYTQPGIYFLQFDKTYTYNVRGRNNRDTRHLIIVNYTT